MNKYRTCGMDCHYWTPTGISRCEGLCALAGELRMEGNSCDMIKEIEERAKLEKPPIPVIQHKDSEQCR